MKSKGPLMFVLFVNVFRAVEELWEGSGDTSGDKHHQDASSDKHRPETNTIRTYPQINTVRR